MPEGTACRLCAEWCRACARRFRASALGLLLAVVLLYLILVAQFKSFIDPLIILLAVPPGTHRRAADPVPGRDHAERHSLMGVVMMVGIVVSNSILIVEFTRRLREDGMRVREAVALPAASACGRC